MDSYRLKEEQQQLVKDVADLKHIKEVMDKRVKDLYAEELRYLSEIPNLKTQYQKEYESYIDRTKTFKDISIKLIAASKELNKVMASVIEEEKSIKSLKETQKKIIEETKYINEQIKNSRFEIKNRENLVYDREKLCESRDIEYKNRTAELDKFEFDLQNKHQRINIAYEELKKNINKHEENLINHTNNVQSLVEQRKFLEEDKQLVKNKLANADKLVKEHCGLKASLLLQADKMSKAIKEAENKQNIIDKAMDDLKTQENVLKIKDFKIKKMAHEAGLEKELKELEASFK